MKGYRTIAVAVITAIIGAGNEALDITSALPQEANVVLVASGIVFAVLRYATTTPIGKSE